MAKHAEPRQLTRVEIFVNGLFLFLGCVFVVVNCFLLGTGSAHWAYSYWEKILYGAAGVAGAVTLAFIPYRLNLSWHPTRLGIKIPSSGFFVLIALWLGFFAFNIVNGGGTIAFARSDVVASRESEASSVSNLREARARMAQEASSLPSSRPAGTLPPLIAAEKNKRLYEVTSGCNESEIKGKTQRNFCNGILALSSELATAERRHELELKIAELDGKLEGKGATAMASADPQVDMIHEVSCSLVGSCFDKKKIALFLPAMVPMVIEFGACSLISLGLAGFGVGHGGRPASRSSASGAAAEEPAKPILVNREQMARVESFVTLHELEDTRRAADTFFAQWTVRSPQGSLSEREWFEHYEHFCRLIGARTVPLDTFRRIAMKYIPDVFPTAGGYLYRGALPVMPKELRKGQDEAALAAE